MIIGVMTQVDFKLGWKFPTFALLVQLLVRIIVFTLEYSLLTEKPSVPGY